MELAMAPRIGTCRGHAADILLVVHEAMERLATEDAPRAELVRLRFFIGLTNAEAARCSAFRNQP